MTHRMFAADRRRRAGLGLGVGAVVLLCAPLAWAQDETRKTQTARPERPAARDDATPGARDSQGDRDRDRDRAAVSHADLDPAHHYSLIHEREEVEILEAQLEAKKAHHKLSEARLQQARDQLAFLKRKGGNAPEDQERSAMLQAELPVLEAEVLAEVAEMREPQVLLKHAKTRVEELEEIGARGGFHAMHRRMAMGLAAPHTAMDRAQGIDEKLDRLSAAVEDLQRQLSSPRREPRP